MPLAHGLLFNFKTMDETMLIKEGSPDVFVKTVIYELRRSDLEQEKQMLSQQIQMNQDMIDRSQARLDEIDGLLSQSDTLKLSLKQ
jgi:hypothetical protein